MASDLIPVAVLCAANKSAYKSMPGVEVYDLKRDAKSFPGGMRVVTHPPCRLWSVHTSHQVVSPAPGEKELGLWCVEQVKANGGILEQPAHSRLWEAAGLPLPSWTHRRHLWAAEVFQAWWGYPMLKKTWLLFVGICPTDVHFPLRLHPRGGIAGASNSCRTLNGQPQPRSLLNGWWTRRDFQ